ncbi:MAG: YdcF family protein, partial [Hyphomicrobiaceae bacterium]
MTGAGILVLLLFGFVLFATAATRKASQQIAQADGIVVLTGGKLRIDEGMQLLRDGRGRRLLITGVNPRTTRNDVKRIANPGAELFDCCVDFGYMA